MRLNRAGSGLFLAAPLLLAAGAALAGEGVEVTVTNDGTEDLLVTVYDSSVGPKAVVVSNMRITGFTTVSLTVPPSATGRANVSWTAVNTDSQSRKCGHADNVELGDSGALTVHADSSCNISS